MKVNLNHILDIFTGQLVLRWKLLKELGGGIYS